MPNGFWYASGGYSVEQARPASAFSKGDLLMFNSTSSVSRIPSVTTGTTDDVSAIALCDSNQSISGKVPILIPEADTHFWASLATDASAVTPGASADIFFGVDGTGNNRYYVEPGSTASARVVIVRGTESADQSVYSQALVKLIYHAGNLTLS